MNQKPMKLVTYRDGGDGEKRQRINEIYMSIHSYIVLHSSNFINILMIYKIKNMTNNNYTETKNP